MDSFSNFNYNNLPESQKADFNKAIAHKLLPLLSEIKNDDVLGTSSIVSFITSSSDCTYASSVVSDIFSSITGGIQAGSGNQNLYHSILSFFTESWSELKIM